MSELQASPWRKVEVVLATVGLVGGIGFLGLRGADEQASPSRPAPAAAPPEKYYFDLDGDDVLFTLDCTSGGEAQATRKPDRAVQTFVVKVVRGGRTDAVRLNLFPSGSDFRYMDWRKGPADWAVIPRQSFESPEGNRLQVGGAVLDIVLVPDGAVLFSAACQP